MANSAFFFAAAFFATNLLAAAEGFLVDFAGFLPDFLAVFTGFLVGFLADFLAVGVDFFLAAMVVSRVSEGQIDERFLGSGRLAGRGRSRRTLRESTQMSLCRHGMNVGPHRGESTHGRDTHGDFRAVDGDVASK